LTILLYTNQDSTLADINGRGCLLNLLRPGKGVYSFLWTPAALASQSRQLTNHRQRSNERTNRETVWHDHLWLRKLTTWSA